MLVVVVDDQGGGMAIFDSTVTLQDLSMNDNSAPVEGPDICVFSATVTCSTSCTAGQYNEQCDIAMSNDGNLQCLINCKVSST